MTLQYKTSMARKEALGYCRRCLAVMLCCVLVFGLTVRTAPRARASITDCTIIGMQGMSGGSSWGASTPGGMAYGDPVGACIAQVAMLGSDAISSFICGYAQGGPNTKYYGSAGYEAGAACWDYLYNLGGDIYTWCETTKASFVSKGGVAPGDSFTIPAEVAQAVQQWTNANFDFVGDALSFEDDFLFGENDVFVLTKVDAAELEAYTGTTNKGFNLPLKRVGQLVRFHVSDFSSSYTHDYTVVDKIIFRTEYTLKETLWGCSYSLKVNFNNGNLYSTATSSCGKGGTMSNYKTYDAMVTALMDSTVLRDPVTLFYSNDRIYVGSVYPSSGFVAVSSKYFVSMDKLEKASVPTTITKNPAIDKPVEEERVVVVPEGLPITEVNGYSVPVLDDVAATDVVENGGVIDDPAVPSAAPTTAPGITAGEISGAIADALPITGAKAGDQVVDEAMNDPDSLGAVFISKFPFSIPWDVAKAISLLAAPPVTPRWEVDFLAPMSDMVGGWQGSTAIVLDFGEYPIIGTATRWVSTLMFVYALAMGTKKLIWTA